MWDFFGLPGSVKNIGNHQIPTTIINIFQCALKTAFSLYLMMWPTGHRVEMLCDHITHFDEQVQTEIQYVSYPDLLKTCKLTKFVEAMNICPVGVNTLVL